MTFPFRPACRGNNAAVKSMHMQTLHATPHSAILMPARLLRRTAMTFQDLLPHLVHVGAILYIFCFLFRDQFYLRLFAILGDLITTFYFVSLSPRPGWSIFYGLVNVAINLVMMVIILRDRTQTKMDDRDMQLYQSFPGMTPGDFRRLKAQGKWSVAEADEVLSTEAESLNKLHFILSGQIEIKKGKRTIPIEGRHFIGEVAYLQKAPASATVTAKPGCTYITWEHENLRSLSGKHDGLKQALGNLLSADLADKIAKA
jgi:hypothetical protein